MNPIVMNALQTRRLDLVPLSQEHARHVDDFSARWEVARYTAGIPHPYPSGDGLAFAREVEFDRRNGAGGLAFATSLKGGNRVIGVVELDLGDDARWAELGYAFSPDVWGGGIALEAANAVVGWSFESARLDAVVASALVVNRASCRLLQKAGFRRIGHSIHYMPERGRAGVFEEYRLLRREWLS